MNKMQFVAFVVFGLIVCSLADVSHLKQSSFASNSLSSDDQVNNIAIKFNNAGNNQNRYWWMNTETSPFTKTKNFNSSPGLQLTQTGEVKTRNNILHETQHTNYNQNPFLNGNLQRQNQPKNNVHAHVTTLSGSPSEVNNLLKDTTTQTKYIAERYRPVARTPCYGASQVCAPKNVCDENGFISTKNLGLVQSQANNCDSQLESCCNILPEDDESPSPCSDANAACVPSQYCLNGFIDQSVERQAVRSVGGACSSPDVCCRLSDRRRQVPSYQDSSFASAQSTSEVLTKEGYVVNVPSNQYLPSFPEPEFNPDASNDDPSRLKPDKNRPKCSNGAPDSAYPDCCLAPGARGRYCCTNGANNAECSLPVQPTQPPRQQPKCSNGAPDSAYPDCCVNGGRGKYCCTNGANNPDCSFPSQPTSPPRKQPKCSNGAPDSAYPDCCLAPGARGIYCCTNGANNAECSLPVQPTQPPRQQPKCSNGAPDSAYPDCCVNGGRGKYCCTNGANNPDCSFPSQPTSPPRKQPKCSNGAPDSAYPDCCVNGGRGKYCCTNGANNPECSFPGQPTSPPRKQPKCSNGAPDSAYPDCCVNGGRGKYCCTNGANNPECSFPARPTPRPYEPAANQPRPSVVTQDQAVAIVPSACPAAMNCTLIEYCTAMGVISKTPVELTTFQQEYRVPMTDCTIPATRELGKCCRDPDYTDPWPIGRLGQYNADELNAVFDSGAYKPESQNQAAASKQVNVRVSAPLNQQRSVQQRPNRQATPTNVAPAPIQTFQQSASCGVRNLNTQPRGKAPLGTGFGEFTWVAMVILESKKALLCGGTIVSPNVVVTSANCVAGHRANDVLIKAGEWRLGSDEEPKPFQIVRVQRIILHPQFQQNTLNHDVALLYLENEIKYDTHIGPICLDEADLVSSPNDECLTTGWGKEVLKVHLGNALMQHTPVSVLPQADCQSKLEASRLGFTDSLICGVSQQDACEVDSGSALACANRSGRYSLKGVYSSETGCHESNQVIAYNRIDLQWIRNHIANLQNQAFNY